MKSVVITEAGSQSVILPTSVAFPEDIRHVEVIPLGGARLIVPAGDLWDSWFDGPAATDDFLKVRDEPMTQCHKEI